MKKLFNLTAAIDWWTRKQENTVRQSFNIDLYFKVLKAKGVIK